MNAEEINEKLQKSFEEYKKNLKKPSILITGGTGVGKSSLINKIFGKNVAKEGIGKPVTSLIEKYESDDLGVILYDSPGYEIGIEKTKKFEEDVINIKEKENINLVWYCIQASGSRITDFDIETIKKFIDNRLPTSIILTKCDLVSEDASKNFKEAINLIEKISHIDIYETSSTSEDEFFTEELKKLISKSIEKLPDTLRDGFISAQKIHLKEKWNRAHIAIVQHITGTFGIAIATTTLIPIADAEVFLEKQKEMIARILSIYDLDVLENIFKWTKGKLMSNSFIKSLASNMTKIIPIVGIIIKGGISYEIAKRFTIALGEAINTSCYKIYQSILNEDKSPEEITQLFGDMVKRYTEKYYKINEELENYKIPD